MGTIFAPTKANLAMGYHEINVYSIISQGYALASTKFENPSFRYLDGYPILLKVNLMNPQHLFSILNQTNNNIQFTTEKNQTSLPF